MHIFALSEIQTSRLFVFINETNNFIREYNSETNFASIKNFIIYDGRKKKFVKKKLSMNCDVVASNVFLNFNFTLLEAWSTCDWNLKNVNKIYTIKFDYTQWASVYVRI